MVANRSRWLVALVLSLVVAAAGGGHAMAQVEEADAPPAEVAAGPATARGADGEPAAGAGVEVPATARGPLPAGPPTPASPRVRAVHRLLVEHAGNDETAETAGAVPAHPVGLGDVIAVEISGLEALIADAGGTGGLLLFLDGIPLTGLPPLGVRPDRGWLIYRLDRTDRADEAWHLLLGSPSTLVRQLSVSVGSDPSHPIATDVDDFPLAVIHPWELAIFTLLLAAAVIGFLLAARRTDLLRDRAADVPPGALRPYSLARCQMAWWFFLIVAAYVFIWLAIDELDTITPSVLALMGIGAATALGAGMIDSGKKQSREEADAALGMATATLQPPPAAAGDAAPQDVATQVAQQIHLSRLQQRSDDMQGALKGASRGFWRDLLWDGDGVSLHRFQIAAWTLVLGAIFVASVYTELAMPEFSATLLGLMGISSGTYLGFKFPERQS